MREIGRADHASTEQLSALLDDRAEPEDLAFLADHVEDCRVCSHELADLRSVQTMLGALPVYLPPRSFTIPIESARPEPRFRRLIPVTQALSAVAAVLCVVLFAADAMQLGDRAAAPVPDGGTAFQITAAKATLPPAKPALSAAESAKPAGAARTAPAAAAAPAPPAQNADTAASASAPSAAAAGTAAPQPAAAQAPARPVMASPATQAPQAAQTAPSTLATATVPAVIRGEPGMAIERPGPATTRTSPWLSPVRLWALGLAIVSAALLIGSFVLSRMARASARTGGARPLR